MRVCPHQFIEGERMKCMKKNALLNLLRFVAPRIFAA